MKGAGVWSLNRVVLKLSFGCTLGITRISTKYFEFSKFSICGFFGRTKRPGQIFYFYNTLRYQGQTQDSFLGNNTLQIDCLQMQKRWWWHYVMHPLFFSVGVGEKKVKFTVRNPWKKFNLEVIILFCFKGSVERFLPIYFLSATYF